MLLGAVGPESLQAYTDAVLGPLDANDRATELLRGLTAFLEHNGHWAAAATPCGCTGTPCGTESRRSSG